MIDKSKLIGNFVFKILIPLFENGNIKTGSMFNPKGNEIRPNSYFEEQPQSVAAIIDATEAVLAKANIN